MPLNTRFCKQTTALPRGGGTDGRSPISVREGTAVAYSVYYMQRREDIYGSDARAFRPERWEGPELADIRWGYLPFNGGPRLCLGSKSSWPDDLMSSRRERRLSRLALAANVAIPLRRQSLWTCGSEFGGLGQ